MSHILLVDDDLEMLEMLSEYLGAEGFDVDTASDGESGAQRALAGEYDLIVLDVMLPGLSGFEILKKVRAESQKPVLMLTARGDDLDRILGLEIGADDYLPKPFNPRELVARLRAVLRRTLAAAESTERTGPRELTVGELEVFPASRRALLAGVPLQLTSTEFSLLEILARHAGFPVSKEELSEHALGRKLGRYDRSIDMHMSNLRRKLGKNRTQADHIQTIRGIGYQLALD